MKARGEILIAEAKTVEEKKKAQSQAQKALDSQMQAVRLIEGQIQAQAKIGQHQATAAKAQLEAKVLTARQNLEQKLVSKEINMSQQEAVKLSGQLANSNTSTQNLVTGTGQVATNAQQSAHMFIQVANNAGSAANAIHAAADAQARLNFLRAQAAAKAQAAARAQAAAQETTTTTTTTAAAAAGAYWGGGFQAFAKGGMVKGPTLGLIGEGGEPEYIIPQSKAAGFAANFLSGKRGAGAIPGFADGGVVTPSSASVSIQTGPVTQMNGQNFVTTQEMSAAVQSGVEQTLDLLQRDGMIRSSLGL